jgi:hypothetical protein
VVVVAVAGSLAARFVVWGIATEVVRGVMVRIEEGAAVVG